MLSTQDTPTRRHNLQDTTTGGIMGSIGWAKTYNRSANTRQTKENKRHHSKPFINFRPQLLSNPDNTYIGCYGVVPDHAAGCTNYRALQSSAHAHQLQTKEPGAQRELKLKLYMTVDSGATQHFIDFTASLKVALLLCLNPSMVVTTGRGVRYDTGNGGLTVIARDHLGNPREFNMNITTVSRWVVIYFHPHVRGSKEWEQSSQKTLISTPGHSSTLLERIYLSSTWK